MKLIDQDLDTGLEVRKYDKLLELHQDGVYITCDHKGAKQLIEILKEFVGEN